MPQCAAFWGKAANGRCSTAFFRQRWSGHPCRLSEEKSRMTVLRYNLVIK